MCKFDGRYKGGVMKGGEIKFIMATDVTSIWPRAPLLFLCCME